jgi:hypothetical protein
MLTISGRALGSKRPLFADFHVPPPAGLSGGGGGTTLRDLIESVVRHEVAAFEQRQADRQFVRVLTEGQIATRPRPERSRRAAAMSPLRRSTLNWPWPPRCKPLRMGSSWS